MKGDRERCEAALMDGYAVKPISLDDLCAEIARVRHAVGVSAPISPRAARTAAR